MLPESSFIHEINLDKTCQ